jgi:bifunctional oligoribonuclease and PAP phosphatase NrnA
VAKTQKPLSEKDRDKIIDKILAAVRRGRTFLLSELAFASFLRRLRKKVDIVNAEPVPVSLMFLPGADAVRTSRKVDKNYDVVVVFECSGPARMGNIIDLDRQAGTVINIDHHAHHNYFGDINLINPKASSNSEQLFYVFRRAKMPITRDEAAALYVGLVTDTGRFQQENTNVFSHEVAAGLLKSGAPVAEIARRIYGTRSEASLRLLSRALASLRLSAGGKVSSMALTRKDFEETSAAADDTEDVVNYGLMIPSVAATMFFREEEDGKGVKVSFRGKGEVDLCRIAVSFGGGGHRNASGCGVPGPLDEAIRRVSEIVEKAVRAETP